MFRTAIGLRLVWQPHPMRRPYIQFLYVRSDVCRWLPSDSVSRRTPLPLAVCFPLSGRIRDLHPLEYAHAGRTRLGAPTRMLLLFIHECHELTTNNHQFLWAATPRPSLTLQQRRKSATRNCNYTTTPRKLATRSCSLTTSPRKLATRSCSLTTSPRKLATRSCCLTTSPCKPATRRCNLTTTPRKPAARSIDLGSSSRNSAARSIDLVSSSRKVARRSIGANTSISKPICRVLRSILLVSNPRDGVSGSLLQFSTRLSEY